jgi:hypothetical protein
MSAPKSDAATIEARRSRLLELLAEGRTQRECAELLRAEGFPSSVNTVWLDVRAMRGQWKEKNMSDLEKWRDDHIAELMDLRIDLEDPTIKPERKIELALAIVREDSRIKGTAAPTRSITASIDVESSPLFLQFKKHTAGLSEAQIDQVLRLAAAREPASRYRRVLVPGAGDEGAFRMTLWEFYKAKRPRSYVDNWHLRWLCSTLERAYTERKNVLVECPPGTRRARYATCTGQRGGSTACSTRTSCS